MYKHNMLKFMDSHFLPKLSDHYVSLANMLQSLKNIFQTHKERLDILKREKKSDVHVNGEMN